MTGYQWWVAFGGLAIGVPAALIVWMHRRRYFAQRDRRLGDTPALVAAATWEIYFSDGRVTRENVHAVWEAIARIFQIDPKKLSATHYLVSDLGAYSGYFIGAEEEIANLISSIGRKSQARSFVITESSTVLDVLIATLI